MTVSIFRLQAMIVSAALVTACVGFSGTAMAVDQAIQFGVPSVLSQQGQRLKVIVPVRSAQDDRATASSFLVRETEVPQGYRVVATSGFTVMRPAMADYIVFQSGESVDSPEVSLVVSVAGDPRSPYRMDLQVPPSSATGNPMALSSRQGVAASGPSLIKAAAPAGNEPATRKLRGPAGEAGLPPK